ncbi:hypothetical protein EN828_27080 [Mesorhizobium sp. M2D.F.Ca.ET.185.01.1.1]|uniref:hypothetical protein n=1 Tax=unclassified Mesorhizobium TaxID=325217 RepID=UPI000FCA0EF0|nr:MULTISPECIES: hypothetical protein [unclassified Mesorhizobium]TGP74748.1 hypothetical protein EN870_26110 [bacterium M00.F.Ca.ET.227.01.1.1]TGP84643.1 hypothetical protein EN864_28915 [bacterium M00.F.Ca.ET.221.01.1.1]TGP87702.1 hypothetical protein EN865_28215 [bacterium M00.F.Ca.ET.222.01.1.1]TGQ82815.1 hypothetical protein EN849_27770 [Mesorhizobium sp. M2D.F.Ca.ET.206.01.1.1]TGS91437.1 hypothetical protein EN821_27695 [Mesorhizobium sp. M2D.F.Ca.ET.178.01.1.1]TGU21749.1 hypothetical p
MTVEAVESDSAASIRTSGESGKLESPAQRFSMPEFVDWHMILDHELSQLTRPETGIIGSIGFVGLGGAIGLAPAFFSVLTKIETAQHEPVVVADVVSIGCFVASAVIAIICLIIFALSLYRNRGLAGDIRARKKQMLPSHDPNAR